MLFTDSLSLILVFYLFLWEAAGCEEPLLFFCSPELDFLGHISDLKLFVGERIGHAGYLAFLLSHTFPGIFCERISNFYINLLVLYSESLTSCPEDLLFFR